MKLRIQVEGRSYDVEVDLLDHPVPADGTAVHVPETVIPETVLRPRPPQKLPEDSVCRSPIAGRVTAVLLSAGSAVRRHQPVVLLDAMKMEVPIGPVVDGTVKAIHVQTGDLVQAGQLLFDLI
jgi:glutaconyl-CoA/methylmalonyl-CoA decarboxylase subunit gamma